MYFINDLLVDNPGHCPKYDLRHKKTPVSMKPRFSVRAWHKFIWNEFGQPQAARRVNYRVYFINDLLVDNPGHCLKYDLRHKKTPNS